MPEPSSIPIADSQHVEQDAAAEGGTSLLAKIRILLFVTAVIVAECVLAWLYLPSASETAAMAGGSDTAGDSADVPTNETAPPKPDDELADWAEVDLGEFSVVTYQPVSGTTLRVDFHLWGMVEQQDENTFLTLMEEHLHRFREQIHFTVRSAEIPDLTDARLALLKRKTLERTNKTLGQPLLQAVIFDDFAMIEQ